MAGLVPFNKNSTQVFVPGFKDLFTTMDDLFGLIKQAGGVSAPMTGGMFKLDVHESETEYIVEADLPGVNKEDVTITLDENTLSISVHQEMTSETSNKPKNSDKNDKLKNSNKSDNPDKHCIYKERHAKSMVRQIYLAGAQPESVQANLKDGVLTLSIKRVKPPESAKRIPIN